MTQEGVLALGQHAMLVTILLAGPVLIFSLVVGLLVSIFQAVTQINEMTLTFIPKLVAMGVAFVLFGPWMLQVLMTYTQTLFLQLSQMTH